jgi:pilus assembly protein CpaB
MRPKSLLLLALALGCGLVASIGISQVMENNKQGPSGVEKESIYVAKVNINTGDPISSEMVMLKDWPKADIPQGAIRDMSELEDRRPRTPIFANEAILESKLLNPGDKSADPTQQIPKGYRIVPVPVRADTGVAGLVRPGDRVDLQWYVARNPQFGIQETVSKTILHNVRVFAVDQTVVRPTTGDEQPTLAKTITVLVNPEDANKLQLAMKVGEISLIGRHPDDPSAEDNTRLTLRDLIDDNQSYKGSRSSEQGYGDEESAQGGFLSGLVSKLTSGAAAAAAMQGAQPPWTMEVVLGGEVQLERFDAATGKPIRHFSGDSSYYGAYGPIQGGFDPELGENPITIPAPKTEDSNGERSKVPSKDPEDQALDFPIDLT